LATVVSTIEEYRTEYVEENLSELTVLKKHIIEVFNELGSQIDEFNVVKLASQRSKKTKKRLRKKVLDMNKIVHSLKLQNNQKEMDLNKKKEKSEEIESVENYFDRLERLIKHSNIDCPEDVMKFQSKQNLISILRKAEINSHQNSTSSKYQYATGNCVEKKLKNECRIFWFFGSVFVFLL